MGDTEKPEPEREYSRGLRAAGGGRGPGSVEAGRGGAWALGPRHLGSSSFSGPWLCAISFPSISFLTFKMGLVIKCTTGGCSKDSMGYQVIDAFELWCWRRLLRVPWTARMSNQSILKEISPGCSLEGLMLKLKLQYFGHLMRRVDSLEKTLMLGGIGGRRRRG